MATHQSIEDLIVGARRDHLDENGLRRLEMAIGASQENRLLHAAGVGFDSVGVTLPDDDLLIARVADRVASVSRGRNRRRVIRTLSLVIAGVSLVSAAAAAGWVIEHQVIGQRVATPAPADPSKDVTSRTSNPEGHAGVGAPTELPAQPTRPALSGVGQVSVQSEPASGSGSSAQRVATALSSKSGNALRLVSTLDRDASVVGTDAVAAAEQFARANRARREGRTSLALDLYRALLDRFPNALEAIQARLAAAELLLQRGQALPALEEFRRARAQASAAEALWGEARALRALNRIDEERQALAELLQRYPRTPYSEAARKRLDENQ